MIALGVEAPDGVENHVTTHPSFADAFMAVTQIVFAYSKAQRSFYRAPFANPSSRPHCLFRFHLRDEESSRLP